MGTSPSSNIQVPHPGVICGRKKRKASDSPTLPSQPKPGSSEPPLGTPVRLKPNLKNKIPVILSGVDGKFKNWRSKMGELRQYHPSLKVSQIRNYQKVIS